MCCSDATRTLALPPAVIEMLAHYRQLLDEHGWDWGDDRIDMFRWARFSLLGDVFTAVAATGDWATAVRSVIGDQIPAGIVVVQLDETGILSADTGPSRLAVVGRTVPIDVVVDSRCDADVTLRIADRDVRVAARGAAVETIDVDGASPTFLVELDGAQLMVERAVTTSESAVLHLKSATCVRWSVTDATGGAWFPDGVLRKFDVWHRPFFHGHDLQVTVPAVALHIACARGLECERVEFDVSPAPDEETTVECTPQRLIDPAADGWYGGDLHIHMNYSGDLVCTPSDAAQMQFGEGLHLANFVVGNCQTSLVYDREMLEQFVGTDLPWSTGAAVAQVGVEYRNDLLGHVHALGPSAPPSRYYAGHDRSDHPEDWPPNKVACDEFHALGATVGYPHPAFSAFPDDWSTDRFFASPRSVEARELVADAALGVVDSIDLISPFDDEGAIFLYHRLLSCGLRLAATAGTDTFLSFSHGPGTASNPPGWGRVYAHLDEEPLTVAAFKEAIRDARTLVTNGPWLTLDVDGHGPGAVLDVPAGHRLEVQASVLGTGTEQLTIVGPDGVIAQNDGGLSVQVTLTIDEPFWIAAVARGPRHANTMDDSALAHTSPVFVDIAGRRVGRAADAQWCLGFLDGLQDLVSEHGHFEIATRDVHLGDLLAVLDDARSFYRDVVDSATRAR